MKDTAQQLELDMGGNSKPGNSPLSEQFIDGSQEKFNMIALGEIAVQKGGSVDPKKHKNETFELYSIPAFDAGFPEIILGSEIGSSKKCVQPDDVMISRIVPHIRRAWVVGSNIGHRQIASGEWIIFRSEEIWPQYLRWVLVSDLFHAAFMQTVSGVGGSLLRARPAEVYKIKIPLPPLEEQKRIARILDTADELRTKRRKALAELDTLLQSVFLDMFGDPVTNPKGWKIQTLEEITIRITDGTHQSPQWSSSGVPFLFVSNIQNRTINFETSKYISEEEYKRLTSRCPIEAGDILYTTVGSYGNPAIVRKSMGPFAFQRHIAHIKPQHELINSTFLEIMLDSAFIRQQADRLARGVAQKTINLKELKSFKIIIPPLIKQCKFVDIAEKVEQQKAQMHAHLAEFDALFASLQHRVFNGEL